VLVKREVRLWEQPPSHVSSCNDVPCTMLISSRDDQNGSLAFTAQVCDYHWRTIAQSDAPCLHE
jgi:hypothetical protein